MRLIHPGNPFLQVHDDERLLARSALAETNVQAVGRRPGPNSYSHNQWGEPLLQKPRCLGWLGIGAQVFMYELLCGSPCYSLSFFHRSQTELNCMFLASRGYSLNCILWILTNETEVWEPSPTALWLLVAEWLRCGKRKEKGGKKSGVRACWCVGEETWVC